MSLHELAGLSCPGNPCTFRLLHVKNAKKGEVMCGKAGRGGNTCRGSTFARSWHRKVVQQMLSGMPVLWNIRSQDLLSPITFLLHTCCLEIEFPPQFWPWCKNVISSRQFSFGSFTGVLMLWIQGAQKLLPQEKELVYLHSYHLLLK